MAELQAVAVLNVALLSDGRIECTWHGADRNTFNMLLKRAEQDLLPKFLAQEANGNPLAQRGISVQEAPPGLDITRMGLNLPV